VTRRRGLFVASASLIAVAALALGAVCLGTGCSSVGYLGQSVAGHLDVMHRARPVAEVLADPATAEPLRAQLQLAERIRDFASRELALPDNRSYRRYAALDRPAAVWNVVAAPALSLTLKTWCFPMMGCVGYRGYYDRADADALAATLRDQGWEVQVYGVPAYSTLGWTNWLGGDPLLSTFIGWREAELARLIFHELAHQVVYVADDTGFNESYATAVEQLGVARWLAGPAGARALADDAAAQARRQQFKALTRAARDDLAAIFADASQDDAAKQDAKARRMAQLRADYEQLKRDAWSGYAGYDRWFAEANNASLAIQAAYGDLVPAFEQLFEAQGRDFARFHEAVRALAALPKAERLATLAPAH